MTPQSQFMVLAPVIPGREHSLRELLATMNCGAGHGRPDERGPAVRAVRTPALCASGAAGRSDARRHRSARRPAPEPAHLPRAHRQLRRAGGGVHRGSGTASRHGTARIFAHCDGFDAQGDVPAWMQGAPRSARRQLHQLGRSHRAAGQGGKRAAPRARRESAARAARIGCAGPAAPARAGRLRRCRGERRQARFDADRTRRRCAGSSQSCCISSAIPLVGPGAAAVPDRPVAAPDLPPAHERESDAEIYPPPGSRGRCSSCSSWRTTT